MSIFNVHEVISIFNVCWTTSGQIDLGLSPGRDQSFKIGPQHLRSDEQSVWKWGWGYPFGYLVDSMLQEELICGGNVERELTEVN